MAKRSEVFTEDKLGSLYLHHPYLLLFQKEDWREYLVLFGQIYDQLEEESVRVPFEVVRSLVVKFYAPKRLANLEQKVLQFFSMAIGELQILKDSHDQFGQRFIETTRAGKSLLQLVENLLTQRTKFSGTGAETLLGALNDILVSRQQMTEDEAIRHHKEKIKAYQQDIQRIKDSGLSHAELLPIPHSNEALFNQAEESAIHILSSIEDVKTAIERQRQDLAQNYFDGTRSAGQSLSAVAEFYEKLYSSAEYSSYNQAKHLLSHLEGFAARFSLRNIDHLLHKIQGNELIPADDLQKSQLRGFMMQFQNADHSIQEKVKAQIKLLQQQVHYSISTDVQGLQSSLFEALSMMLSKKERAVAFFEEQPLSVSIAAEFEAGPVEIFQFEIPPEIEGTAILDSTLAEDEQRALFLALLQAEETTLQNILAQFRKTLEKGSAVDLREYAFTHGLAEYYVLSEIEIFDAQIIKSPTGVADLIVPTKHGEFVLREIPTYVYSLKDEPVDLTGHNNRPQGRRQDNRPQDNRAEQTRLSENQGRHDIQ